MLSDTFPKHILKLLYLTLVYPYFNYCNLIWGSAYMSTLYPLVILQKKCIRTICNANFLSHTDPLFKSTKLLKLHQIHELNCVIFIYKCFNSAVYSNFRNAMVTSSQIHHYSTRRNNEIRPLFNRLQLGINSFLNKGIILWNDLPNEIKYSNSRSYFKSKVKNRLLNTSSA